MKKICIIITILIFYSCNSIKNKPLYILHSKEVKWEKLNPARGNKSPQAGTLWGNRNGNESTGFLAKFSNGFSSPPHIHNVTYRAIVIKGNIHNNDPEASLMWMQPGSFWTQPKGEAHITAAKGNENIAYVEIDNGPYLVKPTNEAFDNAEQPINIDASNLVWLSSKESKLINKNSTSSISHLWEYNESKGLLIKLPKNYNGKLTTIGSEMHAIIIKGELLFKEDKNSTITTLNSGSYFGSLNNIDLKLITNEIEETIIYIRTNGKIFVN